MILNDPLDKYRERFSKPQVFIYKISSNIGNIKVIKVKGNINKLTIDN